MNRVIVLILCLASAAGIAGYTQFFRERGDPAPVYVVSQRPDVPKPTPPAATNIDPRDRVALARALQRELKRVGCYGGEITGVWTTSSRMAMKAFTERVNATLPVDAPDPVLLSLVQGHREKACATACPAGQTVADGGVCASKAVPARTGKSGPEEAALDPAEDKTNPVTPTAAAAAALALTAPKAIAGAKADAADEARPEGVKRAPPEPRASDKKEKGAGDKGVGEVSRSGPVPPEGMREKRPRRSDQTTASRPPKVVRDVLRALGLK
jgi:hypothetical protein